MMYVVETFDGISGESAEFKTLDEAKKYFDKEVAYHKNNGLKYEFIELNRYEDDELVETIEEAERRQKDMYDYSKEHNRVDLVKTSLTLTRYEFEKFKKKEFTDYEVLQTWDSEHFQEAEKELEKYKCSYGRGEQLYYVKEYALIFYSLDEDGEEYGAVDFITAEDESTIKTYHIIEKEKTDGCAERELVHYTFEMLKAKFEPDKKELPEIWEIWNSISDMYDLKSFLHNDYDVNDCYFEEDEVETLEEMERKNRFFGYTPINENKSLDDKVQKKHYKDFEKVYLGLSDIAALVMVGCNVDGAYSQMLNFGSDGDYFAYLVEGEDVEIGSHYKEVASFESWLKIYDDYKLFLDVRGKEIKVYRAGDFGCIIQVIK